MAKQQVFDKTKVNAAMLALKTFMKTSPSKYNQNRNSLRSAINIIKKELDDAGYFHDKGSMKLYRIFPAPKNKTVENIERQSVFVTSKWNLQSWSKSPTSFDNNFNKLTDKSAIVDFVRVQATISRENILLDTDVLYQFLMDKKQKYVEANTLGIIVNMDYDPEMLSILEDYRSEREVFVDIKGKEIKVDKAWALQWWSNE